MKINGQFFEVTNVESFAVSYLLNPAKPTAGTFKTAANIRIELASILPNFPGGFFPGISVKTNSASDGTFGLNVSDAQLKQIAAINKMAYFVAYRQNGSVHVAGQTIPIFEPVYRSEAFDITKYKPAGTLKMYFAPYAVPNSAGIAQSDVDTQIGAAKKSFKDISKLSASIQDGCISVSGSGRGAEIKFKINPSASTSFDLSSFIKGKVVDLDIDLPGPDFIVGICVSKDDIGKEVDKGIAGIMKEANKTIEKTLVDQVAAATGQTKTIVSALFKTTASVTFRAITYPVVEQKSIKIPGFKDIKIDVRAIVPKISIGFPRIIK